MISLYGIRRRAGSAATADTRLAIAASSQVRASGVKRRAPEQPQGKLTRFLSTAQHHMPSGSSTAALQAAATHGGGCGLSAMQPAIEACSSLPGSQAAAPASQLPSLSHDQPSTALASVEADSDADDRTQAAGKWRSILARYQPVNCKGHGEPCVLRKVLPTLRLCTPYISAHPPAMLHLCDHCIRNVMPCQFIRWSVCECALLQSQLFCVTVTLHDLHTCPCDAGFLQKADAACDPDCRTRAGEEGGPKSRAPLLRVCTRRWPSAHWKM
jgi:hypothetical protein